MAIFSRSWSTSFFFSSTCSSHIIVSAHSSRPSSSTPLTCCRSTCLCQKLSQLWVATHANAHVRRSPSIVKSHPSERKVRTAVWTTMQHENDGPKNRADGNNEQSSWPESAKNNKFCELDCTQLLTQTPLKLCQPPFCSPVRKAERLFSTRAKIRRRRQRESASPNSVAPQKVEISEKQRKKLERCRPLRIR